MASAGIGDRGGCRSSEIAAAGAPSSSPSRTGPVERRLAGLHAPGGGGRAASASVARRITKALDESIMGRTPQGRVERALSRSMTPRAARLFPRSIRFRPWTGPPCAPSFAAAPAARPRGRTSGRWGSTPSGSTGRSSASPRRGRGTMPCNLNQLELSGHVAAAVDAAGGVALPFNTIAVSDNQTQGTPGMRASLISREVIADSIELMAHAHDFDALVCLVGCDKTVPAALMALARVDKPAVVLYSGPMRAGRLGDRELSIQDMWEARRRARARRDVARRARRARARGVPRAGHLRRAVHREHDGDRGRVPRPRAGRRRADPRRRVPRPRRPPRERARRGGDRAGRPPARPRARSSTAARC